MALLGKTLCVVFFVLLLIGEAGSVKDPVSQLTRKLEEVLTALTKTNSTNVANPGQGGGTAWVNDNKSAKEKVSEILEDVRGLQEVIAAASEVEICERGHSNHKVKGESEMESMNVTTERLGEVMSKTKVFVKELDDLRANIYTAIQNVESQKHKEDLNENCCKLLERKSQGDEDIRVLIEKTNENLAFISSYYKQVNVAQNKEAFQSSTFVKWSVAERAVDGHMDIKLHNGRTCSQTKYEVMPWWMVDLGENFHIGRVVIYNRGDNYGERLTDFEVLMSKDRLNDYEVFASRPERSFTGEVITLRKVPKMFGRFIKIQLRGTESLQLCEVMAFYE